MLILGKRKHSVPTLFVILIIFASKSNGDEGLQDKHDGADKANPAPVTAKVQEGNPDEKDNVPSNAEETSDDVKPEKSNQSENPNDREENQYAKPEQSDHPPQVVNADAKQSNEKAEEPDQHSVVPQEEKVEENKSDEADGSQKLAGETKKQNVKIDDSSRKISLSDVNSITCDESHPKPSKRETRTTEFLGLPRDASYFFDDHEPFINNNSAKDNSQENARASRAIPSRDNKAQKAKLGGHDKKDMIDEEAEEEEDDDNEKVEEEEEKASEGDYDDDEDMESDCQPTTTSDPCADTTECTPSANECSSTTFHTSPQCTTKAMGCSSTRKTTTKCTTKFMCPTKCQTTVESTKCPRICAKGNDKQSRYPIPEKTKSWDLEGKRSKKKFRGKNNLDN